MAKKIKKATSDKPQPVIVNGKRLVGACLAAYLRKQANPQKASSAAPVVREKRQVKSHPASSDTPLISKGAIRTAILGVYQPTYIPKQVFIDLNAMVHRWLNTAIEQSKLNDNLMPMVGIECDTDNTVPSLVSMAHVSTLIHSALPEEHWSRPALDARLTASLLAVIRANAVLPDNKKTFSISVLPNKANNTPMPERTTSDAIQEQKPIKVADSKVMNYIFTYDLAHPDGTGGNFTGEMTVRTREGEDKAEKLFYQAVEFAIFRQAGIIKEYATIKVLNVKKERIS